VQKASKNTLRNLSAIALAAPPYNEITKSELGARIQAFLSRCTSPPAQIIGYIQIIEV
jgi:hypothetical protein